MYNRSPDRYLPKPRSYSRFIPKRFGNQSVGESDVTNSRSHLDLTVDKELFHRLPVALVKSRVMHPDPKRQGQLQVWISCRGNDISHLTKHRNIRNPCGTLHFIHKERKKSKQKEMEMLVQGTVETNGGKLGRAVRWTANSSQLSLKQQELRPLHASVQWNSGTPRISLEHAARTLEISAHEPHYCRPTGQKQVI